MPNEFIARNGVIALNNSIITGSLGVTSTVSASLIYQSPNTGNAYTSLASSGNSALLTISSTGATINMGRLGAVSLLANSTDGGIIMHNGAYFGVSAGTLRIGSNLAANDINIGQFAGSTVTINNNTTITGSLNITGSITTTGTITAQTLVVQTITSSTDFVTGSTRFGSLLANTHQFTGSVSMTGSLTTVGTASFGGPVGIGTTTPSYKLDVNGTSRFSSDILSNGNITIDKTSPYLTLNRVSKTGGDSIIAFSTGSVSAANYQFWIGTPSWANSGKTIGLFNHGLGNWIWKADDDSLNTYFIGNVGIGTTTPLASLAVSKAASNYIFDLVNATEPEFILRTYNHGSGTPNGVTFTNGLYYNTTENASIKFYRGGSTTGGFLTFTTNNGSERMRIDASGYVGIGTTSPSNLFEVNGISAVVNSFGAFTALQASGSTGYRWTLANDASFRLQYTTNGFAGLAGTPLYVSSSGNVGIETTSPAVKLDVRGTIQGQTYAFPNTAGSPEWVKVGTLTIPNFGYTAHIRAYIHQGFDALNSQDFYVDIFFKTSNLSSTNPFGFGANSWYYSTGFNNWDVTPKWVGNAPGTSATAYDLYLYLPYYNFNSQYIVEIAPGVTWLNVGSLGQSDPGSSSSTVCISSLGFNIPIGNVGIGKSSPNAKLDISGSALVSGSLTVTSGITGSLFGTSSFASTASFVPTSSLVGNFFVQGGNSFGTQALLGTNDTQNLALETSGSIRMFVSSSGNVGIGTTTPSAQLEVVSTVFPVSKITRSTAFTTALRSTYAAKHLTSGDMADGFGADISFLIQDNSNIENEIANFGAIRDGADNNGALIFSTRISGSRYDRIKLWSDGRLGLQTDFAGVTSMPRYKMYIDGNQYMANTVQQLFTDSFNRANVSPGGTPSISYVSGSTGASTPTILSSDQLRIPNSALTSAGYTYLYGTIPVLFNGDEVYNTVLQNNTGILTWTFNSRTGRATPLDGLGAGQFGLATILAMSGTNPQSAGNVGYAVISVAQAYYLVYFSNGISSYNVICNLSTTGTQDYYSVEVMYDCGTGRWTMGLRSDGVSAFANPASGQYLSQQTATGFNVTTAMPYFGWLWNFGTTAAVQSAFFDNFNFSIETGGTISTARDILINGTRIGTGPNNTITNLAAGYQSMEFTGGTGVTGNTAIGAYTLYRNNGGSNTAIGVYSLFINGGGNNNVGIGAYSLYNNTTGGNNIAIGYNAGANTTTGTNNIAIGYGAQHGSSSDSNSIVIGSNTNGAGSNTILMGNSSTTTITIPYGNVGIGTTSPGYKLDVSGTIRATGDVIAYSDARVKDNITTIENALEKIKLLRGVSYTRKDDTTKSQKVGVIAQEVLSILPEVVQQDDQGNYSVAYGNIVGVLIEAIKEQQIQIDELKKLLH